MSRSLRLHEDADRELGEAVDYYDLESDGLGDVFITEVQAAFDRVREHPESAAEVASGVRKLVLSKFPFSIIYEVRPDVLRVLAIAHQRKRPHYWRRRR